MTSRHSESAFESVIEGHLLQYGYVSVDREGFDRERAIFPEAVLAFIRQTQPTEWAKLEAPHDTKTGEQILAGREKRGHSTLSPPSSQSMTVGAAPDTDTSAWQHEIDQLVYALYGLTPEEIKLIEDSTQS